MSLFTTAAHMCVSKADLLNTGNELYRSFGVCSRHDECAGSAIGAGSGLAYATLALSTDYDCWHTGHDEVSVESVIAIIKQNVANAKAVIKTVCERMAAIGPVEWPAHSALAGGVAIMTARDQIPEERRGH